MKNINIILNIMGRTKNKIKNVENTDVIIDDNNIKKTKLLSKIQKNNLNVTIKAFIKNDGIVGL
jgi:hypothetical protein